MKMTIEDLKRNGASIEDVSDTVDGLTVIKIVRPENDDGQKDIEYNFTKEDGSLLLEYNVDELYQFSKGLAFCKFCDNVYNFIKKDGTCLLENDLDGIYGDFCNSDIVEVTGPETGANYIDVHGNTLFPCEMYTQCEKLQENDLLLKIFEEEELFKVRSEKGVNIIKRDGTPLLKDWYHGVRAIAWECGGLLEVMTLDPSWRGEDRRYNLMFADQQKLLLKEHYSGWVSGIERAMNLLEREVERRQ